MSDFYNRETIDAKLDAIHETGKSTLTQAIKTNGRVTDLEQEVDSIKKWRYIVTGGMIVIGALGATNISLLAKVFSEL